MSDPLVLATAFEVRNGGTVFLSAAESRLLAAALRLAEQVKDYDFPMRHDRLDDAQSSYLAAREDAR